MQPADAVLFLRVRPVHLLVAFTFWVTIAGAGERMAIAILPPENLGSNINAAHWQHSLPAFLEYDIGPSAPFFVLPEDSVKAALRVLNLQWGKAVTQAQARELGVLIEARRVILGNYIQESGTWRLKMQVVNAASGRAIDIPTISAGDWNEVVKKSVQEICESLGYPDAPDDGMSPRAPFTKSPEALELTSRAYVDLKERKPLPDVISKIRKSLEADPKFPMALRMLVYCLVLEGAQNEAMQVARQLVKDYPNYAGAHGSLGLAYLSKNIKSYAREEFAEALRLDPDEPDYHLRLAELQLQRDDLNACASEIARAIKVMPLNAGVHAFLGATRARQGQRDSAIKELHLAERFNTGDDPGTIQWLARGYESINDPPKAVEYYEKLLAQTKAQGMGSQLIDETSAALMEQKSRLVPHWINAREPRSYAADEFEQALRKRLSPRELASVHNPFVCTSEMKLWLRQAVSNSASEEKQAYDLYAAITRSGNSTQDESSLSAELAFKRWSDPHAEMNCQDYTVLYVAMARSLGLRANYTFVSRDYTGNLVSHACAVVFVGTNAILVDPTYKWFGVPHQVYQLQDDLQVAGVLLTQSADKEKEDIGLKIAGDWGAPHFWVAFARFRRGSMEEAREPLREGLERDGHGFLAEYGQAVMATHDQKWKEAANHLKQCLELNPYWNEARFVLGEVLRRQQKLVEAREQWRLYLEGNTDPKLAAQARESISQVNESLADIR
jgi:tetratricopeptide (TPR) repeat protein